ncbi:MAG: PDZ domain-containing protein [Planctomycetota bacterium]
MPRFLFASCCLVALLAPLPLAAADAAEAVEAENAAPPPAAVATMRPFLGVAVERLAPERATALGLEPGVGLHVRGVEPDSPASAAGLQRDDVLVRLDDQLLIHPEQLAVLIRRAGAGAAVALRLRRAGDPTTCNATLAERSAAALRRSAQPETPALDRLHERLARAPLVWRGRPRISQGRDLGHSVETRDGTLIVRDKHGQVVLETPLEAPVSEEDAASLEEIEARLEALERAVEHMRRDAEASG